MPTNSLILLPSEVEPNFLPLRVRWNKVNEVESSLSDFPDKIRKGTAVLPPSPHTLCCVLRILRQPCEKAQ